ncbi:MAG: ATPase, T2SS/T4P/T4SS family [Bdellovibrionota bacterium]
MTQGNATAPGSTNAAPAAAPLLAPSASAPMGHVIAIVGGKGGVGKSVFAANLALSMAYDSKKGPLVLDCDPNSTGDINLIYGIKQAKGYGDALIEGKVPDGARLRQLVTPVNTGNAGVPLFALQMLSNLERFGQLDEAKLDLALSMIRKTFPLTIIDCGNAIDGPMLKVFDHATMILVPTVPEILVLNQTKRLIDKLQSMLYSPEITKVVVNRFPAGSPYNPQFLEQTLKRQVIAVVPEDSASANASLAKGSPMILVAPQSAATKGIQGLSRFIIEKRVLEQLAKAQKAERPKPEKSAASSEARVIPLKGKGPTDPRSAFKLRVHAQLVERMDLKKEELDRALSEDKKADLRTRAQSIVADVMNAEEHPWKAREESAKLMKEILDEAIGLGPLEEYLADPTITEVMVCRADLTYIEKGGKLQEAPTNFSSNEQLRQIIERIVNPIGRRIDEKSPYVDARLPDGSRVHAIIPPLSIDGPMITIRKFPTKRLRIEDLVGYGSMSQEMADFLRAAVECHANVLISGGTGSGKTTLLNVLSSFIPANERILTVEDAAELQLQQKHVGRLESRPANIEGTGAVTIRDLVKQTLRMRPDRIIIGEVRAGEALDMLQAMNTGHDGSMATVHSNNPRDAIARLETLVMMAGMDMPVEAIRSQIAGAVHIIVQQSRLSDGSRRVTHVTEVIGMQGDVITMQDIFLWKSDGIDKNRKVIGRHMATGFMPKMVEKFEALGIRLPKGIFKAA